MYLRRDFQPQTIQPDKSRRVVLVVSFGRVGFHRGDVRIVVGFTGDLRPAQMMLPL